MNEIKMRILDLTSELMSCLAEVEDTQFVDDICTCVTYNDEYLFGEIRESVLNEL